ncbi:MAG TPA: adenylate/guanylate cyclase domain-containing protein [Acidimicrobiales bacterium]|nr:adenylate/guanylate cyclase domain-containing protein [Acidimicrobiales bacterium]
MSDGGTLDPGALGEDAVRTVRSLLADLGCSSDELDAAESEGTLPLLAVDRLILPEVARHDLGTVSERTGLTVEQVRQLWRSLGYPVPRDDEAVFTDSDVDILGEVGRFVEGAVAPEDLLLQMSRVIGSSMARVASAQADVIAARAPGTPRSGALAGTEPTDEQIVVAASALLPIVPRILGATWRRHLRAAIAHRMSVAAAGTGQAAVVGFADLVGFTALSQQVSDEQLAAVVDRFEHLAFDLVTDHGGRVVKMIGDEVMFTVESAPAAAETGLALSERTGGAGDLLDVRVGMAQGPVLEREGDLYGPVVNLASRITAIAHPGSIVVDEALQGRLEGDEQFWLRSMRPRYLKHIGRVPLWVLRRSSARRGDRRPPPAAPRHPRR